jgi:hypothetical protein
VAVVLIFKEKPLPAALLALIMVLIYIPMTYYTDRALYRRRRQKQQQSKS